MELLGRVGLCPETVRRKYFVWHLFKNVPVLDSGARGATTTFVERGIGDVLINWENEILLSTKGSRKDKFEIVVPPISILAEPTVSVVDKIVDPSGQAVKTLTGRCNN